MKHVLMTGDAVGGVWRYSLDLAAAFVGRGVRVSVAVLGPPPSVAQAVEARAAGVDLIATGLPLDWTVPDAEALRATAAELAGLAHRLRVDRVHLHAPALAAHAPWTVPVVAVAHSDLATWWQAVHGEAPPARLAWHVAATGHGLAEADAVLAPSVAFAAALERAYRPGRRIAVVRNGSASVVQPVSERARRVLVAGRLWDEAKNVALLDRMAPFLGAPIEAAGPLAAPGGQAVAFPALDCLGPLSAGALAVRMATCSVYASAARYEPFGLAVLEAARAGMALALSDIPTHRELWDGAALFFHPEDASGACDVLRRLLTAPEAAGARAAERAARYGVDAMAEGTLAVHRALALQAA